MAVTFKQLLNRALRITGEPLIDDATTAVTDEATLVIAEMANEVKEEVEAAHNWRALRQQVTTTVTAGNTTGTISEGNERSRAYRVHEPHYGELVPLVFDITDSSNPYRLLELDLPEILRRITMNPNLTQDPSYFALNNAAEDTLEVVVFPAPADTRTIQLDLIIPQARLDAGEASDLAANIDIPTRPILMGLIRYIFEERGEELGPNSMWSEEKWQQALNDAIALDRAESGQDTLVPT